MELNILCYVSITLQISLNGMSSYVSEVIRGLVWLLGSYALAQQLWRLIALLVLAKPLLKRSQELLPSRLSPSVALQPLYNTV